jgi:hypothetical protein
MARLFCFDNGMKCDKKDAINSALKRRDSGKEKADFIERLLSCISSATKGQRIIPS